jgi:hypothetical protein
MLILDYMEREHLEELGVDGKIILKSGWLLLGCCAV